MKIVGIFILLAAAVYIWFSGMRGPQKPALTHGAPQPIRQALSVVDAYRAIPHVQTIFSPQTAGIPKEEAQYLHQLFTPLDAGGAHR